MLSKKTWKPLSVFLLLFFACSSLFASDEDVHYTQLLSVLFGRPFTLSETENRYMFPLSQALYLTVDLYNNAVHGKGQKYLDELKRFGVENLPRVDAIDFSAGPEHQRYTHRGWDWIDYPNNLGGYNYQKIWDTRKQMVMMTTIDKIFNFREDEMIKRDSFAALLYYMHILGDHIGDRKGSLTDRMPLNGRERGRTATRADIIWELEYHIPRLFREQTNTVEYRTLMRYFENDKTRKSTPPFVYSNTIPDDDYRRLQAFAKEILDKLIENIPGLLKKENFFSRVFY